MLPGGYRSPSQDPNTCCCCIPYNSAVKFITFLLFLEAIAFSFTACIPEILMEPISGIPWTISLGLIVAATLHLLGLKKQTRGARELASNSLLWTNMWLIMASGIFFAVVFIFKLEETMPRVAKKLSQEAGSNRGQGTAPLVENNKTNGTAITNTTSPIRASPESSKPDEAKLQVVIPVALVALVLCLVNNYFYLVSRKWTLSFGYDPEEEVQLIKSRRRKRAQR